MDSVWTTQQFDDISKLQHKVYCSKLFQDQFKGGYRESVPLGHQSKSKEQNQLSNALQKLKLNLDEIKRIVGEIPWFSYRKNFPPLLNSNLTSDQGWGCMLRVGQMAWAQLLKTHLQKKQPNFKVQNLEILQLFVDDDTGEHNQLKCDMSKVVFQVDPRFVFSIQKIVKVANELFGLLPGQWYQPNQIVHTLSYLHEAKKHKGTEDLKIVVFNDGEIYYERLLTTIRGIEYKCKHVIEKVENDIQRTEENYLCTECVPQNPSSVAFFIITRIGLDNINHIYFPVLEKLIRLPQFQGILGGRPQKALYFVGQLNDEYLYLDPHYVQNALHPSTLNQTQTTCVYPQITKLSRGEMDPSMAISFYIKDEQELKSFWENLMVIKNEDPEGFFISTNKITPDYVISRKKLEGQIICLDEEFD